MSKIKICGLFRECDVDYVNEAMPDFAGFIINFQKSHRSIDYDTAKLLIYKLSKDIKSVCVFVDMPIDYVMQYAQFCDIIQLHGNETNEYIGELRSFLPGNKIWKAFKIRNESDIITASNSNADMVLMDNGYGTGNEFDWTLLEKMQRKFILAGGIDETNVGRAIQEFSPYAVDVSSGVESRKLKDLDKIERMVKIVRAKSG